MTSSSPHGEDIQVHAKDILSGKSCQYLVRNLEGEGSFGKVARCIKTDTMESVAIKIVRKHLTEAGRKEASAFKQICILDLNKSNLVRFCESFMHNGHMCLVLEMLDKTLHDLMNERGERPLLLSEIRVISQQMLVALNALKSIGLVHADIKPDNIMLVNHCLQPFRVKLIDFSCSTPVSTVKRGTTIQTLAYRAPEVILGLPVGVAVDMWSLGCVLGFMYVRQHLYPVRCRYEVMRVMVQMHGQPDDHLLNAGLHTTIYFSKNSAEVWRLKTAAEYTLATGQDTHKSKSNKYSSIDDLRKDHPEPRTAAEHEDTQVFLSLLKRMLDVDSVTRVTPADALGHSFITMAHFTRDPDPYVTSSHMNMAVCPPQDPPPPISCYVTASEVLHRGAATSSSDASPSPSAGLADTTTIGNNDGTDDAASPAPASVPGRPNEVTSGGGERTSWFNVVNARRTMLERIRTVCCCCRDFKE